MQEASTEFTGERPGWGKDFDYDEARHLAAYRYAMPFAAGRRVVDAGCGEGWGTQILADGALSVVGLDYSADAIAQCRRKWNKPNLTFRQFDLTRAHELHEQFDLVINFQVLEHMRDDLGFLQALQRLVAPGGCLLLTTPNRLKTFSENPYHVREYTAAELRELAGRAFRRVDVRGMHGNDAVQAFDRGRERAVKRILRLDPLGIRKLLPAAVINFAFAKLAVLVRRDARATVGGRPIVPEDFYVSGDNPDDALDLVALCEM